MGQRKVEVPLLADPQRRELGPIQLSTISVERDSLFAGSGPQVCWREEVESQPSWQLIGFLMKATQLSPETTFSTDR